MGYGDTIGWSRTTGTTRVDEGIWRSGGHSWVCGHEGPCSLQQSDGCVPATSDGGPRGCTPAWQASFRHCAWWCPSPWSSHSVIYSWVLSCKFWAIGDYIGSSPWAQPSLASDQLTQPQPAPRPILDSLPVVVQRPESWSARRSWRTIHA